MLTDEQRKHYATATHYVCSRREKRTQSIDKTYLINRGDILILVMLIEQDMNAVAPSADIKRLAAIREKLGNLVFDAPEMSKEEAQQFR
jgi:hypothetical protein